MSVTTHESAAATMVRPGTEQTWPSPQHVEAGLPRCPIAMGAWLPDV